MKLLDVRSFTPEELSSIKNIVNEGVKITQQINDLKSSLADAIKNVTSTLNDGLDKDMHIKTSMINKLIKTKIKENLDQQKDEVSDLESFMDIL